MKMFHVFCKPEITTDIVFVENFSVIFLHRARRSLTNDDTCSNSLKVIRGCLHPIIV